MVVEPQHFKTKIKCPKCEHGDFEEIWDINKGKYFKCDVCGNEILSHNDLPILEIPFNIKENYDSWLKSNTKDKHLFDKE